VRLVHIAQSDDPGSRDLSQPGNELVPSSAHTSNGCGRAESHHRAPDRVTGSHGFGRRFVTDYDSRQPKRQPGRHRILQEVSARCLSHIACRSFFAMRIQLLGPVQFDVSTLNGSSPELAVMPSTGNFRAFAFRIHPRLSVKNPSLSSNNA
jgi:hypothetical protein